VALPCSRSRAGQHDRTAEGRKQQSFLRRKSRALEIYARQAVEMAFIDTSRGGVQSVEESDQMAAAGSRSDLWGWFKAAFEADIDMSDVGRRCKRMGMAVSPRGYG
jgi:hypothetical protein